MTTPHQDENEEMKVDQDSKTASEQDTASPGFTLVEMLIALMVLAVGLLAVAGIAGAVAGQTRMSGSVTGQTAAGQAVLEDLQMRAYGDTALTTGSHTRDVNVASHTYSVDYSVTELTANRLKEVSAVVGRTLELPPDTMRTLVYRADGPATLP